MGWFSDALFGERKRMDPNKVNSFMADYDKSVGEQMSMARDMMDPNSQMNVQQRSMLSNQNMDAIAAQNQGLMGAAAMAGVSPGQAAMQSRANMSTGRAQMGQQYGQMMQNQQAAGQSLFGRAMQGQQGIGERQSNMYMEKINAHNAARQQNQAMVAQVAGAAMTAAASDIKLKENIELVGKSLKGVNIYEFDYKDKSYGKGRYKGVMAQEVPNAAFKHSNGYLWVDYSKVDVNFERIN